ncbi:MAG: PAS domain S-box protein [Pirellulales bacterium]
MSGRGLHPWIVAALSVIAATLVRMLLDPWWGDRILFVTFFIAIAVSAWYGGVAVGVVTALVSYLVADYLFVSPRYELTFLAWDRQSVNSLTAYLAISATILGLTEVFTRTALSSEREAQRAIEQRKLLEVTLGSIGDAVISTDAQRRITYMNGVAETLTGWRYYEAENLPIERVFHIINEQSRSLAPDPIAQVIATRAIAALANHTILITKEGGERPIDDSAAPIFDEQGQMIGAVLVFRDVTQRREAEQVTQKLAAIVEHSDDAIIGKNMAGVITNWNQAAQRLYGYTAAEAIGQPIRIIVPQDHVGELNEIMRRLKAGERIEAWDTVRVRKDGTRVDVSLRISPIKNRAGEVVGASKVARDISQRKRNEESLAFLAEASGALAALTDRESALQQVAHLAVPFFADWCVVYCCGSGEQMLPVAYSHRNPAKVETLSQFLHLAPFDPDAPTASAAALRTGQPQLMAHVPGDLLPRINTNPESLHLMRELDPRSMLSVPLSIRGETIGVMTFVVSESNRRYTQLDVRLAENLAQRVATAIDNSQLFRSVQDAVRQKDDFLAMLSHELRNPLAAIGYATALAQLPGADAQSDVFPVIERQVTHLKHLIDDLLDVARISRDKINLKLESVDLAQIARDAAESVRPLMEEKHHQFLVEISSELVPVLVDVTRAEQVMVNLLTNSAKYTPENGRVSLFVAAEGAQAVIRVSDNGIGLAPEIVPKVFDLFAQGDRTLDRSQGGLGIGLTIVRKLVEMHGGNVSAHSAGTGQGAEFLVRLPLAAQRLRTIEQVPEMTAPANNKQQLVVVDDNVDTARLSAMMLRTQGFDVDTAHDGESALELIRAKRPDGVLLDIGLPRMNGYEVAKALRNEGFAGKLIAVSGYGQAEDRRRSQEAGFDHHLVKPVDHRHLVALLRGAAANA